MGVLKLSVETVFLRDFAQSYVSEISFTDTALRDMEFCGVGLQEVLFVLRNGIVIEQEKEDADGVDWVADGQTCDGTPLRVVMRVWVCHYQVRVMRVFATKGVL